MKKTTLTAAIASVLAAGIAGLTVSAPLAIAAPTPSAPSTPKVSSSAAPTKSATSSTKTQVRGKLTPPRTSSSPVVVTLSGLRPGDRATLNVAIWRSDDPGVSVSKTVAADGTVTLSVPAPRTGWPKPGEGGIAGDLVASVRQSGSQGAVWEQVFTVTGGDRSGASGKDASGGLAKTGF